MRSQLAVILACTPATAVRLVDRMERDGWVTRQIDPKDGRVKRLVPTEKRPKSGGKVSHFGRQVLNEAYQGIHPSEIETVKRVLDQVRRNLGGGVNFYFLNHMVSILIIRHIAVVV